MAKHWSNPVAIGGEAFLHFFLPEQGFFTIRASEATMANGAIGGLLEQTEQDDGLHSFESERAEASPPERIIQHQAGAVKPPSVRG